MDRGGVAVEERPKTKPKPEPQALRPPSQPKYWQGTGPRHTWEDDQKALQASRHVSERKRASDLIPPVRTEGFLLTLMVLLLVAAGLYFWLQ
ncbi:hypothetical protein IIA16_00860 [bacterium]|nr:hypothetical protein [bacterium]